MILRRIFLFIGLSFGLFIVLTLSIFLYLRSSAGNQYIKQKLEAIASDYTATNFAVGKLETNILNQVIVQDVSFRDSVTDSLILSFENGQLNFSLFGILRKKIDIHYVELQNADLSIMIDSLGSPTVHPFKSDNSSESDWTIALRDFKLTDSHVSFQYPSQALNEEFSKVDLRLINEGDGYQFTSTGAWKTSLAQDESPKFSVQGNFDSQYLDITSGVIQESNSAMKITGRFRYDIDDIPLDLAVTFEGNPNSYRQLFSTVFESDIPHTTGDINAHFRVGGSVEEPLVEFSSDFTGLTFYDIPPNEGYLRGSIDKQIFNIDTLNTMMMGVTVEGSGWIKFDSLFHHKFTAHIPGISASRIGKYFDTDEMMLSGSLSVDLMSEGPLLALDQTSLQGSIGVKDTYWQGKSIPSVQGQVSMSGGQIDINLSQGVNRIGYQGKIDSSLFSKGAFDFSFIEMGPLAALTPLVGLTGHSSGSGILEKDSTALTWQVQGQARAVNYKENHLDKAMFEVSGSNTQWIIKNSSFEASHLDLRNLNYWFKQEQLEGKARVSGKLRGSLETLTGNLDAQVHDFALNGYSADSLKIQISANRSILDLNKTAVFKNDNIGIVSGTWAIEKAQGHFNFDITQVQNTISRKMGQLNLTLKYQPSSLTLESKIQYFDLSLLRSLSTELESLSGILSGSISLKQVDLALETQVSAVLVKPRWKEDGVDRIEVKGGLDGDSFIVESLHVKQGNSRIQTNITGKLKANSFEVDLRKPLDGSISWEKFDLALANPYLSNHILIEGHTTGNVSFTGKARQPLLTGFVRVENLDLVAPDDWKLFARSMELIFKGNQVQIPLKTYLINDTAIGLSGAFVQNGVKDYGVTIGVRQEGRSVGNLSLKLMGKEVNHTLSLQSLDLSTLSPFLQGTDKIGGKISGSFRIHGLTDKPELDGHLSLTQGSYHLGETSPFLEKLEVNCDFQDPDIQIESASGTVNGIPFLLRGQIRHKNWREFTLNQHLELYGKESLVVGGSISSTALALRLGVEDLDIAILQTFIPYIQEISGRAQAELIIEGEPSAPSMTGYLNAKVDRIKSSYLTSPLKNGSISIRSAGRTVTLDSLRFAQGTTGVISASGNMTLNPDAPPKFNLNTSVQNISFKQDRSLQVKVQAADFSYVSKAETNLLSGSVLFGAAQYRKRFAPQDLILASKSIARVSDQTPQFLLDTRVQLRFKDKEQIVVNNNLANLKLRFDMSAIGSLQDPTLLGRIQVTEGYILYLDRRFAVTEGTLDFATADRINPTVQLKAMTEMKGYQTRSKKNYKIYLELNGPLDAATFNLRSTPELDTPNILALLTMGATREDLVSSNPNMDGAAVTKAVQARLEDYSSQRISAYTSERLGSLMHLDDMSIEGNLFDFGENWGPQLLASKKLTEKTTLTYKTTVGHSTDQSVQLNYKINDVISVEGQTDQQGRSGLDLKVGWRFK